MLSTQINQCKSSTQVLHQKTSSQRENPIRTKKCLIFKLIKGKGVAIVGTGIDSYEEKELNFISDESDDVNSEEDISEVRN